MFEGLVDRDIEKLNLIETNASKLYKLKTFFFLIFLFSITNCTSKKNTVEPIKSTSKIEEGFELCHQASKLYNQENNKVLEALKLLEDGIKIITVELDSKRNSAGSLPSELAKYEEKLFNYLAFRKVLREQSFIYNQRNSKNSGN